MGLTTDTRAESRARNRAIYERQLEQARSRQAAQKQKRIESETNQAKKETGLAIQKVLELKKDPEKIKQLLEETGHEVYEEVRGVPAYTSGGAVRIINYDNLSTVQKGAMAGLAAGGALKPVKDPYETTRTPVYKTQVTSNFSQNVKASLARPSHSGISMISKVSDLGGVFKVTASKTIVPAIKHSSKPIIEHTKKGFYYATAFFEPKLKPVINKTVAVGKYVDLKIKGVTQKIIPSDWKSKLYGISEEYGTLAKGTHGVSLMGKGSALISKGGLKTMQYSTEFSGGFGGGLREKPTQTIITTGAFFVLPAIAKPIGNVLSKSSYFIKAEPYLSKGLTTLYGGSVAFRAGTNKKPIGKLGSITSTEILPMMVGLNLGGRYFQHIEAKHAIKIADSQFISAQKMTRPSVLLGKEQFPTAPANIQYKLFTKKTTFRLPKTKGYASPNVYHAAPNKFSATMKFTGGSSEVPGLYGSSEASIYFLKLGKGSSSLYSSTLFDFYGTPRIVTHQTSGFGKIPKGFKRSLSDIDLKSLARTHGFNVKYTKTGSIKYGRETEFLLTHAKEGTAYVSPIKKNEIESVFKVGTGSQTLGIPYYTKVPTPGQAKTYEFFTRRGSFEAVTRVKKFNIFKPSTYIDKLWYQGSTGKIKWGKGMKPGQFKSGNIKKGRIIPIEERGLLKGLTSKTPTIGVSDKYLYGYRYSSSGGSYSLLSGISSIGNLFSSSSFSSYSPRLTSSNYSFKRSYGMSRSYSPRRSSRIVYSSPSSVVSSGGSSGKSYGGSSYSSSYSPSISIGSSRISIGSGSSISINYKGDGSSIAKPSLGLSSRRLLQTTKFKRSKNTRKFKYTASIVPGQFGITGKKPKILTGLSRRPLINMGLKI